MAKLQVDPSRWQALSALLDQAMDLSPGERLAWVESLDGEWAELKPPLRELLARAAAVETGDFLHTLPKFEAPDDAPEAGLAPGELVGGYRLVRELGEGGMGAVWLAQRADGLIQRPVALKLPHLVAARRAGLAERMAREREILATLDHRNIAKLLDAGVTQDGQPFLALEYVEGVPIDRYCADAGSGSPLGLRDTLRLFRQVADAVAYAHAKLVVHRDLKPANILVTAGGGVKLLDFGIAKLLQEGEARATQLTEITGRALTLDYASPEQIAGQPLTVASDVYSLGVILFELLTGARPYRLKRDSRGALEDAILRDAVPRPSEVAGRRYGKVLSADLDTLVGKALKKDPSERYATVNALAEDVERFLTQRPLRARPDSGWYRFRKFFERNRLAVLTSLAVGVALVSASLVAVWQMVEARAQRDLAERQLLRAESVKSLMVQVFESADPAASGGKRLSAADLLDLASTRIVAMQIPDPLVRAEILRVLGRSLLQVKSLDSAEAMARQAMQAASQLGIDHEENLRARLLYSNVLRHRGDTARLREELATLLPALEVRAGTLPAEYVEVLRMHAHLEIDANDYQQALKWAKAAAAQAEARFRAGSVETATSVTLLALSHVYAGQPKEALLEARRGRELALAAAGGNAQHPLVIDSSTTLARALESNDLLEEAVELFDTVIRDGTAAWGPDNMTTGYHLQNVSGIYRRLGDLQSALDAARRSLRIAQLDSVDSKSYTMLTRRLSVARTALAMRRYAEAAEVFARVVAEPNDAFGPTHPNMFAIRSDLAFALAKSGRMPEARVLIGNILKEAEAAKVPAGAYTHRWNAARIERARGDHRRAIALLREVLGPASKFRGEVDRALVQVEFGLALADAGQWSEAREALSAGLGTLEQRQKRSTPEQADAHLGLSRVTRALGDREAALKHGRFAHDFWQAFDATGSDAKATAAWLMGLRGS